MKWRILLLILVIPLLIGIYFVFTDKKPSVASESTPVAPKVEKVTPPTVSELFALTNAERKKNGVEPLELDSLLNKSAKLQGVDMVKNDYYGHVNPKTGIAGVAYIDQANIGCFFRSENIAADTSSKGAVNDWLISPKHKEAMLDRRYESTGFAIVETEYGYSYFVQHFCDKG